MIDWDSKDYAPPGPARSLERGEEVAGEITHISIERNPFDETKPELQFVIDGRTVRAHSGLWQLFRAERVQLGERVRIVRLPDDEAIGNGHKRAAFTLERKPGTGQPKTPAW